MRDARLSVAAAVVALVLAACGTGGIHGSESDPEVTTTTAVTTTTSTLPPTSSTTTATTTAAPTTTTAPPTTTTLPPTTTTLPPPPVVGWEGEGIYDLMVEMAFDRPVAAMEVEGLAAAALRAIGLRPADGAEAGLTFTLEGTPLSAVYGTAGRCYTGARVTGTATLTAPDRPALDTRLSGEVPTPMVTFGCETDPDYAPFADAFEKGLLAVATGLWGPAAVPFLVEVVERPIRDSVVDLALKAAAMDEFRSLNAGSIPLAERAAFLEAVIETVAYLVETGHTPHGADQAARRVLGVYAGTDFGISTGEDVEEWRAWLADWVAEGGS